jgi:hypothetical protein
MCNTNTTCSFDDASLLTDEPGMIEETTEFPSGAVVEEEDEDEEEEEEEVDGEEEEEEDEEEEDEVESIQIIGKMIQEIFHSDNAKVNAALVALYLNLDKDKKNCEILVTAGGCLALVQLLNTCLDKAIARIPACDQVTRLNTLAELTTLDKTLFVIISLTYQHDESAVGIASIGGVDVVVRVMKTFPKCQKLQDLACTSLGNLACCGIGKVNAIESGGIEVILASINNHLGSAILCKKACWALRYIVSGSKENVGLLISLGGVTAVAKVRTKWPDNNGVQIRVRKLASLFVAEMKAW